MKQDTLGFGKYRHYTPDEVAKFDPSYIVWCYLNVEPQRISKTLYEHQIIEELDKQGVFDLIEFPPPDKFLGNRHKLRIEFNFITEKTASKHIKWVNDDSR